MDQPMDQDALVARRLLGRQDELLSQLYQTAVDSAAWQGFLDRLVEQTCSRSSRLLIMDKAACRVYASSKVNIDDADHRDYVEHFVNTCPWRPELANKPTGRLYSTFLDFSCDQKRFYQTEFFNDWARQQDIHHGVCGTVYEDPLYKVQLLVQRTKTQGHYSATCTALINQLMPHIRQALRLNQAIQTERTDSQAALRIADNKSRSPFILFNADGQLSHITPSARAALENTPGITITGADVEISDPLQQQAFKALKKRVLADARRGHFLGSATLTLSREPQPPLRLLATPVPPQDSNDRLWPAPSFVAIYVQDPLAQTAIDETVLASLYGLTSAEARIAAGVAQGKTPQEIASQSGTSLHTIRTQLKAAFSKTATNRQHQLAALVLQSPAIHEAQPLPAKTLAPVTSGQ